MHCDRNFFVSPNSMVDVYITKSICNTCKIGKYAHVLFPLLSPGTISVGCTKGRLQTCSKPFFSSLWKILSFSHYQILFFSPLDLYVMKASTRLQNWNLQNALLFPLLSSRTISVGCTNGRYNFDKSYFSSFQTILHISHMYEVAFTSLWTV